jgi:hypothetical protein
MKKSIPMQALLIHQNKKLRTLDSQDFQNFRPERFNLRKYKLLKYSTAEFWTFVVNEFLNRGSRNRQPRVISFSKSNSSSARFSIRSAIADAKDVPLPKMTMKFINSCTYCTILFLSCESAEN